VANAIIYVPAYLPRDREMYESCKRFTEASGVFTVALALRDVAIVDHLLEAGWAEVVIVARPQDAIVGWPVRVVSDVIERRGATVVPLSPSCGRHRAPSDSLIGRVVRHPTCEIPIRRRPSAEELIDARVARWATQFPEMRRSE
jgi:hypothetical protein